MNDDHGGHIPRTGKLWKDRAHLTDLEMAELKLHVDHRIRDHLRAMLDDPKNPPAPKS